MSSCELRSSCKFALVRDLSGVVRINALFVAIGCAVVLMTGAACSAIPLMGLHAATSWKKDHAAGVDVTPDWVIGGLIAAGCALHVPAPSHQSLDHSLA